jgi:hypothetical protein
LRKKERKRKGGREREIWNVDEEREKKIVGI